MDLWISDVDGVLTNLKAEPNEDVLRLTAKLGAEQPFCYITGRAAAWLEKNITPTLTEAYKERSPYFSLLGAECGSIRLLFDTDKGWRREYASDLEPLEPELRQQVEAAMKRIPGVMFDYDKEMMISVEADHSLRDSEPEVVEQALEKTARFLQDIADRHEHVDYLKTTYASDIVPKGLNKAYGTRMVLEHLDFTPAHVHLLGDSISDLLLADPLIDQGIPYTLHFVGDEKKLTAEQTKRYTIEITEQRYDAGTREVLEAALK
jgi:hydroxymethylpyrimidine pyrophosphatase-like HAD family hydrolase